MIFQKPTATCIQTYQRASQSTQTSKTQTISENTLKLKKFETINQKIKSIIFLRLKINSERKETEPSKVTAKVK